MKQRVSGLAWVRHDTTNVTAALLAEVIDRETALPFLLESVKELAEEPCSTKGLEDLEGGCCRSCRARDALAKATGGAA
jgi:hypothetical protein